MAEWKKGICRGLENLRRLKLSKTNSLLLPPPRSFSIFLHSSIITPFGKKKLFPPPNSHLHSFILRGRKWGTMSRKVSPNPELTPWACNGGPLRAQFPWEQAGVHIRSTPQLPPLSTNHLIFLATPKYTQSHWLLFRTKGFTFLGRSSSKWDCLLCPIYITRESVISSIFYLWHSEKYCCHKPHCP